MTFRRKRGDDGAAAVEFAMIFPLFIALVFGIIEYGYYFWTAESANSAARESARRIIVGDCWGNAEEFARRHAPQTDVFTVDPAPAGLSEGDLITVTVQADTRLVNFPFIPVPEEVERSYEARMEVAEPSTEGDAQCVAAP